MGTVLDENIRKLKAKKTIFLIGMGSILMMFAALTSAYMVRKGEGDWIIIETPDYFVLSTFFVLLTSFFLYLVQKRTEKNIFRYALLFVFLSFLSGIGFCISQYYAYLELTSNGVYLVGTNVSASFLYVISMLHFVHIISGLIVILLASVKLALKKYNVSNILGLHFSFNYWHFLGFLWIYLYAFIVIV